MIIDFCLLFLTATLLLSGSERILMNVSDTKLILEIYLTIFSMGNSRRTQSVCPIQSSADRTAPQKQLQNPDRR